MVDAVKDMLARALEDIVDTGFVGGPQLKRAKLALDAYNASDEQANEVKGEEHE